MSDDIKTQIQKLQQSLTGNLATDAPIRAEIFELKRLTEGVEEPQSCNLDDDECLSCGA